MQKYKISARNTRIIVNTPDRPDEDCEMAVDVNKADLARLLSAAPDLLAAAKLANKELLDLGVGSSASPALQALWAAIAKAEGQ